MKSVWCSGRKLSVVWVAPSTPLPKSAPDPIAIFDWLTW
jgi:hypothetical protein